MKKNHINIGSGNELPKFGQPDNYTNSNSFTFIPILMANDDVVVPSIPYKWLKDRAVHYHEDKGLISCSNVANLVTPLGDNEYQEWVLFRCKPTLMSIVKLTVNRTLEKAVIKLELFYNVKRLSGREMQWEADLKAQSMYPQAEITQTIEISSVPGGGVEVEKTRKEADECAE